MNERTKRPRAVVYYVGFDTSLGGAEYAPLILVRELLRDFDVVFALDWAQNDPREAMRMYGIDFDRTRLQVEELKPRSPFLRKIDAVIPLFSVRRLQRIARDCELCVSGANVVDFGKPGFHFIYLFTRFGDNAFMDFCSHRPQPTGWKGLKRRLRRFLAETILRPLWGVRSTRKLIVDPRERVYSTSEYVRRTIRAFYGDFNNRTIYPPTIFEFDGASVPRDPLKVVYIGRLTALKGVKEILRIVERTRELSGLDLKLSLAGAFFATAYVEDLKRLVAERPWAELVGELYGEGKRKFLLSGTFAVHACRYETFGIAIAEYLKAGVVPVVPDDGGAPEVVASPELTYTDDEDAARILANLARDAAFRSRMQEHCRYRAGCFARERFAEEVRDLIKTEFLPSIQPS